MIAAHVEPRRLRRAIEPGKWVKRMGPAQFVVGGGREPHHVDLDAEDDAKCDCRDLYHRGGRVGPCWHVMLARMTNGDLTLLQQVGDMLQQAEERQVRREREAAARPTAPRRARRTTQTEG